VHRLCWLPLAPSGERGPGGEGSQRLEHRPNVSLDILRPHAHHADALVFQQRLTSGVVPGLSGTGMNAAIYLDGHAQLVTVEVEHEGADWMLTAELEAIEAAVAQLSPQQELRRGEAPPELASGGDVVAMHRTPHPWPLGALTPGPSPTSWARGTCA